MVHEHTVESEDVYEGMPDEELLYDLADLFKVFGDTTRIKILYALMNEDLSVGDIAEKIEASQSAVSVPGRTWIQRASTMLAV